MQNPELIALERAIDVAGGQAALARLLRERRGLKVQQGHIWHWLRKSRRAPADHAIDIEAVTDGMVTRYDLRPDVFGTAPQSSGRTAA